MGPRPSYLELRQLPWSAPSVCVIGDVMVDAYMWGHVHRMSPEAPVPVVDIEKREKRVGGAGNVVKNLDALGAQVHLISVVGDDDSGAHLTELLSGICQPRLIVDAERPTSVKTRIISSDKHVLRVDEESTADVSAAVTAQALRAFDELLASPKPPEVVVLEDYDKGLMTPDLIQGVLKRCEEASIHVAVDPKLRRFSDYKHVALFKPNLKELNEGLTLETPADPTNRASMVQAVNALMSTLGCACAFVTLGEHGAWIHAPSRGVEHVHLNALDRDVVDVSGAGDTVIATAALMLAAGSDAESIAAVANLAGGWVCENVGVVPISRTQLESELTRLDELQRTTA